MRPSLESLRVLEACVSAGSFARAAERLCLTPAAVSLRIRKLEDEFGKALFVRNGPRVTPTPEARLLADRIRYALAEISDGIAAFEALAPLRVTAPPTFAMRWLTPRLSLFRAEASVEIELDVSSDVREPSDFDVAIRTGRGAWPGLEAHPLLPLVLAPLMTPSVARDLHEPSDLTSLTLLPHPDWPRWFMAATGDVPEGLRYSHIEYPTHELNATAAIAGQGVALAPAEMFASLITDGVLATPFDCVLEGPDWHFALLRAGEGRSAPRQFCAWLRDEVQPLT